MISTVSRFQVINFNEMQFPHKCATCGSFSGDNGKRFVDFGAFIEFYGNVYFCTECFIGAAGEMGLYSDGDDKKYKAALFQIEELRTVVTTLINENRGLRDAVDTLRSIDYPHPDTYNVPSIPAAIIETGSVGPTVEPENSDGASGGDNQPVAAGESGLVEQTDVGGHSDVRDDDVGESNSIGLDIFSI